MAQSAEAAPPLQWHGFYIGGNVGGSWGESDTRVTLDQINNILGSASNTFPGTRISDTLHPDGFIGGGQLGILWQPSSWVYGFEADIQGSDENDSSVKIVGVSGPCTTGTCAYVATSDLTAKLSWFGTVRGRIGQDWNGWLLYLTGGFAYGQFILSGSNSVTGVGDLVFSGFKLSETGAGWTVGGGVERALFKNWTWRVEYLFIDLGSFSENFNGGRAEADFTDNIVRFALNLKLGSTAP